MDDGPAAGSLPDPVEGRERHDERHALLVAALLDRDLAEDERLAAERLLATCAACTALHAELLLVTAATRELPAVGRSRDFTLTTADAERLRPVATRAGEPLGAASRLTGDMQVPQIDHDRHDQLLIASLLDRSAGGPDRDHAEGLVASCDPCAALLRDLESLREATRAHPTPPRLRDFTLSVADASRLRRRGWRQVIAVFGSTRDAFSRPLAIGLTTLGLVGLLATSIPGVLSPAGEPARLSTVGNAVGGAGANPESASEPKGVAASSAAPSVAPPVGAAPLAPTSAPTAAAAPAALPSDAAPSDQGFDTIAGSPGASTAADAADTNDGAERQSYGTLSIQAAALSATADDRGNVLVVAGLLLVAGLALFALRWSARRV